MGLRPYGSPSSATSIDSKCGFKAELGLTSASPGYPEAVRERGQGEGVVVGQPGLEYVEVAIARSSAECRHLLFEAARKVARLDLNVGLR
jgi:hypothetical protein